MLVGFLLVLWLMQVVGVVSTGVRVVGAGVVVVESRVDAGVVTTNIVRYCNCNYFFSDIPISLAMLILILFIYVV